jgi:hypothetical protein
VIPRYEIRVRGRLSKSLASEFERLDLAVSELRVETVLNGSFEDQAALYGILRQIEGLGLVDLRGSGARGPDEPLRLAT